MKSSWKSGFTLIELLVTVAIIALLSSIVLAALQNALNSSTDTAFTEDMFSLQNAFALYRTNNNDAVPACNSGSATVPSNQSLPSNGNYYLQCDDFAGSPGLDTVLAPLISGGDISTISHFPGWPNFPGWPSSTDGHWAYIFYQPSSQLSGYYTDNECSSVPVSYSSWQPGSLPGMLIMETDSGTNLNLPASYSSCTNAPGPNGDSCYFSQYVNTSTSSLHVYCIPLGAD